ncbi:MAG: hypothetical protein L3J69_20065 [Desulfobacula sp.]|nr:hypothetical protein [Desulfobacula sp.]
MEDVSKIYQTRAIKPDKKPFSTYELRRRKKKKHYKEVKKNLSELAKIVDETHKELEEKDSPFRVCVYQDGDDVFIDIVTIDEFGHADQVFKHDISHDELEELVAHIKSGRGLILDADA